jgi:hypothetical protein
MECGLLCDVTIHTTQRRIVEIMMKGKGKAIPVTGCEGLDGSETSRLPHFLDSQLTDGGKVVRLTRRPPFTPRKIPGINFC